MKVILSISTAAVLFFFSSCKKERSPPIPAPVRTITYLLYTTQDFSTDNNIITFRLNIRNTTQTLFDSALASMRIKDIPNAANKLVFKKIVPGNDASDLAVGFRYAIDNVGNSWFTDTCGAGELFKVVDYDFR